MSFSTTPREIREHILDYVPLDQRIRSVTVNKQFSKISAKQMQERCCSFPTTTEIANWLWDQSQLMKYENTYQYAVFSPQPQSQTPNYFVSYDNIIRFRFDRGLNVYNGHYWVVIGLNVLNGNLWAITYHYRP